MSPADFMTAIVMARALDRDSYFDDPASHALINGEFALILVLTMLLLCASCLAQSI